MTNLLRFPSLAIFSPKDTDTTTTNSAQVMFIATWIVAITYWFQLLLYPSRYFSHTIMLFNTIYSSLTATIGTVWLLSLLYRDNNIHFGFVAFVLILFV